MDDNEDNNDMIWCPDCSSVVLGEHNCSAFSNNFENKNDYLEALIAAVFERESLWNSALPYKFRGPSETKALWSEIDGCLNTAPGTSQAKWKNLKDRFVKEHSLQCTYIPSGSKAIKQKSNWPFYESLRFLVPTINYRKTKSNIENVHPNVLSPSAEQKEEFNFSSVPGVSSRKENNISQQSISQSTSSLLKSQNFQSKQISSRSNSANSDILKEEELVCTTKRNNSARSTPDSEALLHSPLPPKRIKISKTVENIDTRLEQAILKELEQMKPTNEINIKPDKIESFTKYLETCLRGMAPDVSKRVINKILQLILEVDI